MFYIERVYGHICEIIVKLTFIQFRDSRLSGIALSKKKVLKFFLQNSHKTCVLESVKVAGLQISY